jgi:hypothetical protein
MDGKGRVIEYSMRGFFVSRFGLKSQLRAKLAAPSRF